MSYFLCTHVYQLNVPIHLSFIILSCILQPVIALRGFLSGLLSSGGGFFLSFFLLDYFS